MKNPIKTQCFYKNLELITTSCSITFHLTQEKECPKITFSIQTNLFRYILNWHCTFNLFHWGKKAVRRNSDMSVSWDLVVYSAGSAFIPTGNRQIDKMRGWKSIHTTVFKERWNSSFAVRLVGLPSFLLFPIGTTGFPPLWRVGISCI